MADERSWSLWDRTQKTAIEWLAVIISMLGFMTTTLVALLAAIMAGVAMFVAIDAHEDTKVYEIYVKQLHAQLIIDGLDPPPLPQTEEDQ